ncbi:MAG TPA: adenylosuccinate lyase [Bacteroidia bacterium]|nr:adenylosuccinate lyase [Bacteroidia bacterium]
MNESQLTAISPIDGRYSGKTLELAHYFSEFALIKYRVKVEIEYFISLSELPLPQLSNVNRSLFPQLREITNNFSLADAERIKSIEKITNHDVKAVEYFIKEKFEVLNLVQYKEFIHFGLTSQDINNTAVPLSVKDALTDIYLPLLLKIEQQLIRCSNDFADVTMLARTHGQPASPTRLGKEFYVFVERLQNQIQLLKSIPHAAKFGGATGNFNAHHIAYPSIDWKKFANSFVDKGLGLKRSQHTTQIEHYDYFAATCDSLKRINTVLIDFNRDIWAYISLDYFKQKIKEGEVGSSAMPHKVNPIDFENSEGNLGIANALYEHLSAKLPISRLQRDLTDSTVLRNVGVPFAHSVIAFKSLLQGLEKLVLNKAKIEQDLEDNWAVVAEAIQTILRRENYPNPYEALKELTRTHQKLNAQSFADFIDTLKVTEAVKLELKSISPHNYTGI